MATLVRQLVLLDRELATLAGLRGLPGWVRKVDMLLDQRLLMMRERDRGFSVSDRRTIRR
jgi:hypothetical protein